MRNYREWDIYKDGMILIADVYMLTKNFPKEEQYGLSAQIRRAAVSIVTNISEGSAKSSSKDFHRFLEISLGSAFEVETLLHIILNLKLGEKAELIVLMEKIESIQKRLNGFIQKIRSEDLRK